MLLLFIGQDAHLTPITFPKSGRPITRSRNDRGHTSVATTEKYLRAGYLTDKEVWGPVWPSCRIVPVTRTLPRGIVDGAASLGGLPLYGMGVRAVISN